MTMTAGLVLLGTRGCPGNLWSPWSNRFAFEWDLTPALSNMSSRLRSSFLLQMVTTRLVKSTRAYGTSVPVQISIQGFRADLDPRVLKPPLS
jgi:hypothetical protein